MFANMLHVFIHIMYVSIYLSQWTNRWSKFFIAFYDKITCHRTGQFTSVERIRFQITNRHNIASYKVPSEYYRGNDLCYIGRYRHVYMNAFKKPYLAGLKRSSKLVIYSRRKSRPPNQWWWRKDSTGDVRFVGRVQNNIRRRQENVCNPYMEYV